MVSNHSFHSSFWEPQCLLLLEIRPLVLRCLTFRKWVWNCFALKGNYSDLPAWRWRSQSNTRIGRVVPGRLCRWLHRTQQSSGGDTALLSVTGVLRVCLWRWCKSWLLSVGEWNAIFAVSLLMKMSKKRRVNMFIVFPQQPIDPQVLRSCTFLSCSGSCCLRNS